jgi:hypothetical protein
MSRELSSCSARALRVGWQARRTAARRLGPVGLEKLFALDHMRIHVDRAV